MKLIQFILGYCSCCERYFVYPKKRRMNTKYENDKMNYCKVCKYCFNEIEARWEAMWKEYYSSRL